MTEECKIKMGQLELIDMRLSGIGERVTKTESMVQEILEILKG